MVNLPKTTFVPPAYSFYAMEEFYEKFDFQSDFLFKNRSEKSIALIESVCELMSFKKGDKLFYEDGVPTGIFLLMSGRVIKYKAVLDDQHQIFYVYTKGDLLGYHALLSHERYQDSCEALDDLMVKFISRENFLLLLEEVPSLKEDLLKNIAHEFGVLVNFISVFAQKTQNIRLAVFLLVLNHRLNEHGTRNDGIDLSRQELANMIGTSRESLGRSLKEFKEAGLISIRKKNICLEDKQRLFEMIGT